MASILPLSGDALSGTLPRCCFSSRPGSMWPHEGPQRGKCHPLPAHPDRLEARCAWPGGVPALLGLHPSCLLLLPLTAGTRRICAHGALGRPARGTEVSSRAQSFPPAAAAPCPRAASRTPCVALPRHTCGTKLRALLWGRVIPPLSPALQNRAGQPPAGLPFWPAAQSRESLPLVAEASPAPGSTSHLLGRWPGCSALTKSWGLHRQKCRLALAECPPCLPQGAQHSARLGYGPAQCPARARRPVRRGG